ncbi:MAG: hypothetical protein SFX73_28960 [Kofleriaceae bacterium]|nr:hypothetical protein [Kofleriaceae bacterium]
MQPRARRWPELRAGLIAVAIFLGLLDGCPLPDAAHTRPWNRPLVDVVRPVQRVVLRPFQWVREGVRFSQRWALFAAASQHRYRLEVQGQKADGTWDVLYRAGDPAHRAYADDLEDERVRGAWAPSDRPQERYPDFARWFGRRVLADHPEYTVVRLWFERIVLERGEVRGTGTYLLHVDTPRGSS